MDKDTNDMNKPNLSSDDALSLLTGYLQRDQELRKDYLEHNRKEFRQRRWKNISLGIFFGVPALLSLLMMADIIKARSIAGDYVSLVRIEGVIQSGKPASSNKLVPAIKKAFADEDAKGVVFVINSPGGTPVQADIIHQAIKQYAAEYPDKPYVAVGEDYMTSGAYWVASASPEICVNGSTITGSIGVIASGFGVDLTTQYAKQFGLERRLTTAGENKGRNDMFLPRNRDDVKKMEGLLTEIHQHFKERVLESRAGRLKADAKVAFSGDHWTGDQALEMGLVDSLCSLSSILHEKFNVEVVADYTPQQSIFDRMKKTFSTENKLTDFLNILNMGYSPQILAM